MHMNTSLFMYMYIYIHTEQLGTIYLQQSTRGAVDLIRPTLEKVRRRATASCLQHHLHIVFKNPHSPQSKEQLNHGATARPHERRPRCFVLIRFLPLAASCGISLECPTTAGLADNARACRIVWILLYKGPALSSLMLPV